MSSRSGGGSKAKITVSISETKEIRERIEKVAKELKRNAYVDVGVLGGTEKDGTSTVLVASAMEYGVPSQNIPSRSFIRSTVFENKEKITSFINGLRKKLFDGSVGIDQALSLLGESVRAMTKKKILDQDPKWPTLSIKTFDAKEKKGSAGDVKMLIDTGQMLNSINYKTNSGTEGSGGGE